MKNIIELAQSRGSTAKTTEGAKRFLLKNLPNSVFSGKKITKRSAANYKEFKMKKKADGRALVLGYPLVSQEYIEYCNAYSENYARDMFAKTKPRRTQYGEIVATPSDIKNYNNEWKNALDLMKDSERLDTAYNDIEFDNKGRASGSATHRELYDFSEDAAIVLVRKTEGSKYGVKTISKKYYLVDSTSAVEVKLNVANLAKQNFSFGYIVAKAKGFL